MYIENIAKMRISGLTMSKLMNLANKRGKLVESDFIKLKKLDSSSFRKMVISTNTIENIYTDNMNNDVKELIEGKEPTSMEELKIKGSIKLLTFIRDNYKDIDISSQSISNLHKTLLEDIKPRSAGYIMGGKKIDKTMSDKSKIIIHVGSNQFEVREHLDQLCSNYNHLINEGLYDPLLLNILFVSEFLAIHPFDDGNGRLGRGLFMLLCAKSGYQATLFWSVDHYINKNRDGYYQALQVRSNDWMKKIFDVNSNEELISYYVDILEMMYHDITEKVNSLNTKDKRKHALEVILKQTESFTISKILKELNGACSRPYLSELLKKAVTDGTIIASGKGKGTTYKVK